MPGGQPTVALDASASPGQTLRTALTLSLVTGTPFRLEKLKLRPEHLSYLRAAEAISSATSEGAVVGSEELRFQPGPVKKGDYLLEVGPPGSAPLLLQCLLYPLALAGGGTLSVRGGTHLLHGPTAAYLSQVWLPAVHAFGVRAELRLMQAGFHPQGGGELKAVIEPIGEPPTLVELPARGTLVDVEVTSLVGGLPLSIAQRQLAAAGAALQRRGIYCRLENRPIKSAASKGSAVFIRAEFENTFAGFSAVGDGARSPEQIGEDAAEQLGRFMESAGALDAHLADQFLVPAGLLAAGYLGEVTPARTQYTAQVLAPPRSATLEVVQRFLPQVHVTLEPDGGQVTVERRS